MGEIYTTSGGLLSVWNIKMHTRMDGRALTGEGEDSTGDSFKVRLTQDASGLVSMDRLHQGYRQEGQAAGSLYQVHRLTLKLAFTHSRPINVVPVVDQLYGVWHLNKARGAIRLRLITA